MKTTKNKRKFNASFKRLIPNGYRGCFHNFYLNVNETHDDLICKIDQYMIKNHMNNYTFEIKELKI